MKFPKWASFLSVEDNMAYTCVYHDAFVKYLLGQNFTGSLVSNDTAAYSVASLESPEQIIKKLSEKFHYVFRTPDQNNGHMLFTAGDDVYLFLFYHTHVFNEKTKKEIVSIQDAVQMAESVSDDKDESDKNKITCYSYDAYYGCTKNLHSEILDALDSIEKYEIPRFETKIRAGAVYLLSKNRMGMYLREVHNKSAFTPLVKENYSEEILEQFYYSVQQLKDPNPDGRICIIQGPPGTGKTFLVRAATGAMEDIKVILVPPEYIAKLGDPEITETILDEVGLGLPILLILEDADSCLSPRTSSNVDGISRLLNMGDGIVGSVLDIRLICTTNVKIEEFDEALVRPGRLISLINVGNLDLTRAEKRFYELGGKCKDFKSLLTEKQLVDGLSIAEVYKLAKETGETE